MTAVARPPKKWTATWVLGALGIVVVAALAADAAGVPPVAVMTAICRRTSSAASSGSRSV